MSQTDRPTHRDHAKPKFPASALYIVLFGLVLLAAIWSMILAQGRYEYDEAVAGEFTKIGNMAVAHEAHAIRLLEEADQLAQLIKAQYEQPGPQPDLKKWLATGIIKPNTFSYVGVTNDKGAVIAADLDYKPISLADRDSFKFHQTSRGDTLRIGEPVVGRATGLAGIPMTRRWNKPDGSFGGVIAVVIDARTFTALFQDLVLGEKDILTLVREDGIVLARRPEARIGFAGNVSRSMMMYRQQQQPVGHFITSSAIDNKLRFVSYRKLKNFALVAAVATDQEAVLAPVRARAARYYAAAAVATLLVLAIGGLSVFALMRQRAAAETMRISESRYRRLFEAAQDGILLLDADTARIEDVNPCLVAMLGYSPAELRGRKLWEVGAFTDVGQSKEMFAQLRKSGYVRYEDLPLTTRDGRHITVEVIGNSYYCEGSQVIQCELRDISAGIEADRALREFKAIIDASDDAIISKSLGGIIRSWNPGAEKLFGYTAAQAIGQPMSIIIPADRREEEPQILARLSAGEKVDHFETVRVHKDGSLIDISATISPIRNAGGQVVGASKIARDITEAKRAEAQRVSLEGQLRESQKMEAIGTLAGGVAHDFNNIIATILGNAALAREDVPGTNHRALQSLDEIRKAGTRARDLVQQILSFSRRQPVERKRIALSDVVADSVRLLRATLPARLSISASSGEAVPPVLADFSLMQQIVINLATNAMQAMRDGPGRITIRLDAVTLDAAAVLAHPALTAMHARHPGRAVRLRLSDTGSGMDAATLARLFEPFFTTKPFGEGTGLGLSVVHGITQMHEGAIFAESQPGEGATFSLYLPPADAWTSLPGNHPLVAPPARAPAITPGQHLLYIDDDESLVSLIKRLLERRGFRVSGFTDAGEALRVLRADPSAFDLVVSDYNMPGMSGLDVARAVRVLRADLPVAIASGMISDELRAQAGDAGVRELIFKATAVEELCEAFARVACAIGATPKAS